MEGEYNLEAMLDLEGFKESKEGCRAVKGTIFLSTLHEISSAPWGLLFQPGDRAPGISISLKLSLLIRAALEL